MQPIYYNLFITTIIIIIIYYNLLLLTLHLPALSL